tara:strand:+ start:809 stop:1525 length:717 start_codon:yes stop_codon:yes gene_type:complete
MVKSSKILVIEDDVFIQQLIGHVLESAGYAISLASTAAQGLSLFSSVPFDLVMLDLNLPDEDGLTVARQIRTKSRVPIFVLSGRDERASRLSALEIGVNDYLVKPVDPQEIVLRVRNLMDREITSGAPGEPQSTTFWFDGWSLKPSARTLTDPNGEDVHLTKAEFDLMTAFVLAPNRVLERGRLLDAIGRLDQPETDRTIDVLISRLRIKIEANPKEPVHIITAFGIGYRFATKVERA